MPHGTTTTTTTRIQVAAGCCAGRGLLPLGVSIDVTGMAVQDLRGCAHHGRQ